MKTLHIIRGLPGSGKTTLAKTFGRYFEADHYFEDGFGGYHWRPRELADAHLACARNCEACMRNGLSPVTVSNTFITLASMHEYEDMAKRYGYTVEVHDLFDAGLTDMQLCHRNAHAVPLATIERMRRKYEHR